MKKKKKPQFSTLAKCAKWWENKNTAYPKAKFGKLNSMPFS
jgi:hypothetical protein